MIKIDILKICFNVLKSTLSELKIPYFLISVKIRVCRKRYPKVVASAITEAIAAPAIPNSGKPNFPKIST